MKWILVGVIGILTGITAFLINIGVYYLTQLKFSQFQKGLVYCSLYTEMEHTELNGCVFSVNSVSWSAFCNICICNIPSNKHGGGHLIILDISTCSNVSIAVTVILICCYNYSLCYSLRFSTGQWYDIPWSSSVIGIQCCLWYYC